MIWEKVFFNNLSTYISIINEELKKEFPLESLSNHIKVLGGYAFKANEYRNAGIPVVRISDFNDERIDLSAVKYYKEDKIFDKFQLYPGDIIIAMTGGTIGKLAIVQDGLGKLYLNQRVGKFQILDKNEFEPEYVYWLARGIQDIVRNLGYGGAQPNVSNGQIEGLQFPFPDRETQTKIIEFLNDLKNNVLKQKVYFNQHVEEEVLRIHETGIKMFTLFKEMNQQQSYLQLLRQTILQEAVQGKLTKQDANDEPASELLKRIKAEKQKLIKEGKLKKEIELPPIPEDEIPFELPKGWVWCRLGEIIKISSGDGLTANQMSKNGAIPVYGGNGINGYHDRFNVSTRTIVIGRVGFYCGSIHYTEEKAWVTDNAFITDFSKENINAEFLVLLLKATNLNLDNSGTAQPVISGRKVYPLVVAFPPLSEQQRIVTKVQQLQQQLNALETQVQQSRQYAQQLLQAVLKEAFEVNKENYATNEQLTMAAEE